MNKWRRFKLVKPENEKELNKMLGNKNITREDLILILSTLELREEYKI